VGGGGAGPTGKVLLMPEDPNAVFIMVATGTGIAPYRSFWRRQFVEDVPNYKCVPPPPPLRAPRWWSGSGGSGGQPAVAAQPGRLGWVRLAGTMCRRPLAGCRR